MFELQFGRRLGSDRKRRCVIVADTWNNCLGRIDLSTAATGTLAGLCGAGGRHTDGLGTEARLIHPWRLIPIPHRSDGRDSPEHELLLFFSYEVRVVDVVSRQLWECAGAMPVALTYYFPPPTAKRCKASISYIHRQCLGAWCCSACAGSNCGPRSLSAAR
jgi:hypothetical protein